MAAVMLLPSISGMLEKSRDNEQPITGKASNIPPNECLVQAPIDQCRASNLVHKFYIIYILIREQCERYRRLSTRLMFSAIPQRPPPLGLAAQKRHRSRDAIDSSYNIDIIDYIPQIVPDILL